ncbi:ribonuclease HII [Arthrobacter zhangbolii]|uniref:Ribonuclease n=1 Tax=Arthrobacter zhangbolii TaxID=2886936 RepID=A0A9X1S9S2_9MICC|nr:ribonuclease HII [Arthrobacter zhangbolii]MCC3271184.1 ribonuclease HII [Arthrobacter zhangbolii]UON91022.1 ribonuclease HII [Arthrobacter zhangbolii]
MSTETVPATSHAAARTAARRAASKAPTLRYERTFAARGHRILAGCDEVGRGALAGPVSVGLVAVDLATVRSLKGVRDSKLLSVADRNALVPKIKKWALAWGVGHASAAEIDLHGLTAALRLAGTRAWDQVCLTLRPDVVLLDGNFNWLSPERQGSLFDELDGADASGADDGGCTAEVHTRIKADMQCLSVAAASVLAKVERDAMMVEFAAAHPHYSWEINKGYATGSHRAAIDVHGPTPLHRMSWRLGSRERPGALESGNDLSPVGGMIGP